MIATKKSGKKTIENVQIVLQRALRTTMNGAEIHTGDKSGGGYVKNVVCGYIIAANYTISAIFCKLQLAEYFTSCN
jgi:hypothetical protein